MKTKSALKRECSLFGVKVFTFIEHFEQIEVDEDPTAPVFFVLLNSKEKE